MLHINYILIFKSQKSKKKEGSSVEKFIQQTKDEIMSRRIKITQKRFELGVHTSDILIIIRNCCFSNCFVVDRAHGKYLKASPEILFIMKHKSI